MGGFLVLAGFAGLGVGLVAAVTGALPRFHLSPRKQALAVMAAGLVTVLAGGALADPAIKAPSGQPLADLAASPSPAAEPPEETQFELVLPPEDQDAAPAGPPAAQPAPPSRPAAAAAQAAGTPRRTTRAAPSAGQDDCDPSYPDLCIAPGLPDLDCPEVGRANFTVFEPDPHRFDADNDGIGCESDGRSAGPTSVTGGNAPPPPPPPPPAPAPPAPPPPAPPVPPPATPSPTPAQCDPSYPGVCIPPAPPDLDCPQIGHRNFTVVGADPHGFDADNDGVGCES